MDNLQVVVVASPFANMTSLYEVDPDADVLLIVPRDDRPFAPWNDSHTEGTNSAKHSTTAAAPTSQPSLRIKVCSRHLALASRVFRNKLQFGSTRSARQSDGRVHLKLAEGFDPKAVSIVMNAIHGRGSKVPKSVDLETLAQIALFVDRFQLLDAVEVYAERWIAKLEDVLPDTYNRDLVLWIYISHVFHQAEVFKTVTRVAATHSTGPIRSLGLPIREKIINHIDAQRQELVNQALTTLHQALDDLTSNTAPCTKHHCDSLLLGELIKSLHKHRLVWPRPSRPFHGVGFATILESAASGVSLHHQRWRGPVVEPWGSEGAVNGAKQGVQPVWAFGSTMPITPGASPEPVLRNGGFELHGCGARKAISRLDELEGLEDGVLGLELESSLGYQLY
ncbi:BTB domain-containing protein [Madurella fahalii]|uniref:BTB domain-containing protein n=1 Tax=Madurella fahalii TaxID=1157608 RepID=A0ABQ0FWJ0_9PEZI